MREKTAFWRNFYRCASYFVMGIAVMTLFALVPRLTESEPPVLLGICVFTGIVTASLRSFFEGLAISVYDFGRDIDDRELEEYKACVEEYQDDPVVSKIAQNIAEQNRNPVFLEFRNLTHHCKYHSRSKNASNN